ncbi:hypothetical protein, partial [uncultured Marinobacter sp.]|uniref:hypothetical protein n=1 Tax=uncultured Marinobacter sp. TaxID=187379 RepID=UPI002598D0F7
MDEVYGDHVHQNSGQHLDGGITDDAMWQSYWRRLVVYHSRQYNVPKGKVGHRFLEMITDNIEGVISRKWNSERWIVFQMVILQCSRDVSGAKGIRDRLTRRMNDWRDGNFLALVQETERDMKTYLTSKRNGTTTEQRAKIFNQKMLRGELRSAVRFLTETEVGSVMNGDDIDEKTGVSVIESLTSKHPEARTPDVCNLPTYAELPQLIALDITKETVEHIAGKLSGAAGPGGSDASAVSYWLLGFKSYSARLCTALAAMASWMANESPPWAAIRALMSGRLIAIDKSPGIRPIGIGETWRRAIAKSVLHIAGKGAKEACGIDQLCAGLESGIEGAIHAMQHMWELHKAEEEWGFLLIDAKNAFNEQNRIAMLWTVRHEWPSGARFTFNCYKHWGTLVIRNNNGSGTFIHSKEGVTQGDPLSMFAYGVGLLPLIRALKESFPAMDQTWYADDAGAGGKFDAIKQHFAKLQEIGQHYGYYPEPTKSILIVSHENLPAATAAFKDLEFTITTGNRYLGGFIGEKDTRDRWIQGKVALWSEGVTELASVADTYPQSAYAGLQKSLQQQWQFVQRVVDGIGENFTDVQKAITECFLPALFRDILDEKDDVRLLLCGLPVKHAGMALPDPTKSAPSNYEASTCVNTHLIAALKGTVDFSAR